MAAAAHNESNHQHAHQDLEPTQVAPRQPILTIRSHSGLSGDMFLAGLLRMTDLEPQELTKLLGLAELNDCLHLEQRHIAHIAGWHANISLPHQHSHRNLSDILNIIAQSGLSAEAKTLATQAFQLLAQAEAVIHNTTVEAIHFHEVGALDSILDMCLSVELFVRLAPQRFIVSPLPITDGSVNCAHGHLPVPAPAVLQLLPGIAVTHFSGQGETLTPTAAALLHVLPTEFGPWPTMLVEKTALVFGDSIFPNVPNGATFALGYPQP